MPDSHSKAGRPKRNSWAIFWTHSAAQTNGWSHLATMRPAVSSTHGAVGGWDQGGCERNIEVFVKIKKNREGNQFGVGVSDRGRVGGIRLEDSNIRRFKI